MQYRLTKGLDIPVAGAPVGEIQAPPAVSRVAVVGRDFGYPRVSFAVEAGGRVREGDTLFTDRRHPEIRVVAPAAGVVRRIERGPRRRLEAVEIDIDGDDVVEFAPVDPSSLPPADLRERLLAAGLWVAFRARPYDRVPPPATVPRAIFVTAIDTNPLAPDPGIAIDADPDSFAAGLAAISRLADGPTYLCVPGGRATVEPQIENVEVVQFTGPHPAGLPGTHIHALGLPIGDAPDLWHIAAQDVIAAGRLLTTGRPDHNRLVGVGGPASPAPRLLRARIGSALSELCGIDPRPDLRMISGSVLSGHSSPGFLGRYHGQVTVLPQSGGVRTGPGYALSLLLRGLTATRRAEGCDRHGWPDAMLALDGYENVWPYKSPASALLRALLTGDDDMAQALGCRGLAEDDLALLTYLSAGKHDFASALRSTLRRLERAA